MGLHVITGGGGAVGVGFLNIFTGIIMGLLDSTVKCIRKVIP